MKKWTDTWQLPALVIGGLFALLLGADIVADRAYEAGQDAFLEQWC